MSAAIGSTVTIDLLRHGDTGQRSYRGQLDDALSDLGWTQLREAVAGRRWDVIVASSMQRCAAFSRELAQAQGVPLTLDARLMEYHFGDWQGVLIEDLAEQQGDALARFWADPVANPPPGAETFAAFASRLSAALDDIARTHGAQRVLVVTHGGVIRLLRCIAEARDFGNMAGIDVPHASIHPLRWPAEAASTHGARTDAVFG
ncbi:histidine phosphatase family protein [Lysobacter korlensis]|uniref:Histidine phosphatase family protein n=1 Tax=Lysobacter korlensis TaxID=553636 RepID=A0ABV6RSD3_9GAMM